MSEYYVLQYRVHAYEDWQDACSGRFVKSDPGLRMAESEAQRRATMYDCEFQVVLVTRVSVGDIFRK